jgi:hypothetical protein
MGLLDHLPDVSHVIYRGDVVVLTGINQTVPAPQTAASGLAAARFFGRE